MHEDSPDYGTSGFHQAEIIEDYAEMLGIFKVLDYGCGKQTLKKSLPHMTVTGYDPCIEGLDSPPEPHDLVACTDVLEHIEPENIDAVLDDLKRVVERIGVFTIHSGPAKKILSDGRNAHLIQEGQDWWIPKLKERFSLVDVQQGNRGFAVIVEPKRDN